MDQLLQFLFKYKWSVFAKGDIRLASGSSRLLLIALVLALGALIYFLYVRPGYRIKSALQIGLILLRASLLVLVALLLMRPVLVVSSVIPQSTSLAVLVDDSRSMQLNDEGGRSRLDAVKALLASNNAFLNGLERKFKVKLYSFSDGTKALAEAAADGQKDHKRETLPHRFRQRVPRGLAVAEMHVLDRIADDPAGEHAQP